MKLQDAIDFEGLKSEVKVTPIKTITAAALIDEIFKYAQLEGRELAADRKELAQSLSSKTFTLMEVQANSIANPGKKVSNLVIQRVLAQNFNHPIVVDFNKDKKGSVTSVNHVPKVIVIDGREKFAMHCSKESVTVTAWVGDKAENLVRTIHACSATCGCAIAAAKKKCMEGTCLQFQKSGRTITLKDSIKLHSGLKAGQRRSKIAAASPPGWEDTVKHMKEHSEVDNPYALAWWMDNEGFKPHQKGK